MTDPTDPITPYDQSYEIDPNPMTDPIDHMTKYRCNVCRTRNGFDFYNRKKWYS